MNFWFAFMLVFTTKNLYSYHIDNLSSNDGVFYVGIDEHEFIKSRELIHFCEKLKIRALAQNSTSFLVKPLHDEGYNVFNCSNTYVNLGSESCLSNGSICYFEKLPAIDTSRGGIFSAIKFDETELFSIDVIAPGIVIAVGPLVINDSHSIRSYEGNATYKLTLTLFEELFVNEYFVSEDEVRLRRVGDVIDNVRTPLLDLLDPRIYSMPQPTQGNQWLKKEYKFETRQSDDTILGLSVFYWTMKIVLLIALLFYLAIACNKKMTNENQRRVRRVVLIASEDGHISRAHDV